MQSKNSSKGIIGMGVLSAIAASLCCITPVLALIAGGSGIVSTFSWLEPARPYLIGLTVLVLGFAWWQKLKPKKKIECDCEANEDTPLLQSKRFLGAATMFAALMLAFPYYAHIFYAKSEAKIVVVESGNLVQANFNIEGMTCTSCESHIKNAVAQLPGFVSAEANHKTGKATMKFDKSKTTLGQVVSAINETGYKVIKQEEIKK